MCYLQLIWYGSLRLDFIEYHAPSITPSNRDIYANWGDCISSCTESPISYWLVITLQLKIYMLHCQILFCKSEIQYVWHLCCHSTPAWEVWTELLTDPATMLQECNYSRGNDPANLFRCHILSTETHFHLSCVTENYALKSLSLSYPKKDWWAGPGIRVLIYTRFIYSQLHTEYNN